MMSSEIMTMEEAALVLLSLKTKAPTVSQHEALHLMPPRKMMKFEDSRKFGSNGASNVEQTKEEYVPMSYFTKLVSKMEEVMGQQQNYVILKNHMDAFMKKEKLVKCNNAEMIGDVENNIDGEEKASADVSSSESDDDADRLVPIGTGKTVVPARVLKNIEWSSYTIATRTLLQTLFSRRTLATHSLTGKKSPAFADKPAKKRLNPNIVGDIVEVVSKRCGVPARLVRGCITTKCADETKMMRNSL